MISADPEGWYAFGPEAMGEEAYADYRRAIHISAQIVAWALVFGHAQQLFTRMVDERGQAVLVAVGGPENPGSPERHPPDAPSHPPPGSGGLSRGAGTVFRWRSARHVLEGVLVSFSSTTSISIPRLRDRFDGRV